MYVGLLLVLEDPDDASESDQTAQVCVSVVNGFLQPGVEVTVTLETFPIDPEGTRKHTIKIPCVCYFIIIVV